MTNNSQRDHEVGAFFAANADRLHRIIARRVGNTFREVIEDACANAKTILVDRRTSRWTRAGSHGSSPSRPTRR